MSKNIAVWAETPEEKPDGETVASIVKGPGSVAGYQSILLSNAFCFVMFRSDDGFALPDF